MQTIRYTDAADVEYDVGRCLVDHQRRVFGIGTGQIQQSVEDPVVFIALVGHA